MLYLNILRKLHIYRNKLNCHAFTLYILTESQVHAYNTDSANLCDKILASDEMKSHKFFLVMLKIYSNKHLCHSCIIPYLQHFSYSL